MNKQDTISFIESGYQPMSISKAFSSWAADNWDQIATECYISTKALNIMRLLGYKLSPSDNEENNTKLRAAHSIAYTTGNVLREKKEKEDGWMYAIPSSFNDGDQAELKRDGIFGSRIVIGKLIINQEKGTMFLLPRKNRTRGYRIGTWDKIRRVMVTRQGGSPC